MQIQKASSARAVKLRRAVAAVVLFCLVFFDLFPARTNVTFNDLTDNGYRGWPVAITSGSVDEIQNENCSSNWAHYVDNRTIAYIHVGKAGGLTVRKATSLKCRLQTKTLDTEAKIQECIDRSFLPTAVLSRQVRYYFHMHAYKKQDMDTATSFLFSLRNPVDRIVSTYRYSHPENCNKPEYEHMIARPWGCEAAKRWKTRGQRDYDVYTICFPSAAVEDFAQSVLSPWKNSTHFETLKRKQQRLCRWMARRMVEGNGPGMPAPHMYYNYLYYANRSIYQFPGREIFGVRTDQIWNDLTNLDRAIGGGGKFIRGAQAISHGSESYVASPVSSQAYQKLCCLLEEEIAIYFHLVEQTLNFNASVKEECKEDVRKKCGIVSSWEEWRGRCKRRLERDKSLLLLSSSPTKANE